MVDGVYEPYRVHKLPNYKDVRDGISNSHSLKAKKTLSPYSFTPESEWKERILYGFT